MTRIWVGILLCCAAWAQPRVSGTVPETRSAQGSIEDMIRSAGSVAEPVWLAYAVASKPREHTNCCYYSRDGGVQYSGCSLEGKQTAGNIVGGSTPIKLEPSREFYITLRLVGGEVTKMRTFSADCELDSTGAKFIYYTGVSASKSLEYLRKLASEPALAAIALHNTPEADAILEGFAASTQPEALRRKALFWLGLERGKRGLDFVTRTLRSETNSKIRDAAVQGVAMSKEQDAVTTLLGLARNDADPKVRSTALFWVAQKASAKAAGIIRDAVDNDPEIQVKEKAVFALSQLPPDQGVPLLMETARNHKQPAIRRKAMFWLGQSRDPRAIRFFEDVLAR